MANVLYLENAEFYVDGVRFGALSAVNPEETDNTSTVDTSDGPVQVGAPKGGSEVKVEGIDMPANYEEDIAQKEIFDKGRFDEATFSGIKLYRDGSKARQTWTLTGGTCSRGKSYAPTDQTTYEATFKTKVVETIEPL